MKNGRVLLYKMLKSDLKSVFQPTVNVCWCVMVAYSVGVGEVPGVRQPGREVVVGRPAHKTAYFNPFHTEINQCFGSVSVFN